MYKLYEAKIQNIISRLSLLGIAKQFRWEDKEFDEVSNMAVGSTLKYTSGLKIKRIL